MSDDRNFISRSQSMAERRQGRAATVDEMVREFSGYDPAWRAMSLDRIDAELTRDEPLTLNGARRLADAVVRRRALADIHGALKKAGR